MVFLNSGILWALLALAIPVILHFFNLQRPKLVLFSDISLVKELNKTVTRRIKFQRWLLLLARLLALAGIILAFSNPVLTGNTGKSLVQGGRSIAIVIDNSYSMNAGNEKGAYFKQGLTFAKNLIQAFNQDDEFLLTTTADLKLNSSFSDRQSVIEELNGIGIIQNTLSFNEILNATEKIFSKSNQVQKELYFISDFQRSTALNDSINLIQVDSGVSVYFVPLASRSQKNVYIASNEISTRIIEKDKPVNMTMKLVNDGSESVPDVKVQIVLEGNAANFSSYTLAPNSEQEVNLSFTPTQYGWLSGYIQLDDYPVEYDNKRYFSIYVPFREKILFIEAQKLESLKLLFESLFDQFETQFTGEREVAQYNLSEYRSVIVVGMNQISSGLTEKLTNFVVEGGNLLFIPGPEAELASVNRLMSRLKIGTFSNSLQIQEGMLASEADLDHPIFEGVFTGAKGNRELDAPIVYKYYPLSLQAGARHDKILSLNQGKPLFVQSYVEKGIVFTLALFPELSWTDLSIKSLYPPLLLRTAQIMTQSQLVQSSFVIGGGASKSLRLSATEIVNLVGQNGERLIPEQYNRQGAAILNFDRIQIREGNYTMEQTGKTLEKISFNIPDSESKLDYLENGVLLNILKSRGLGFVKVIQSKVDLIANRLQMEREGLPLWKYLLLFGICCLLLEIAILKLFKAD